MKQSILFILFCLITVSSFAQIKLINSNPANGDFGVDQDSVVLEFNMPVFIDIEDPELSGFYFFIEPEDSVHLDSVTVSDDDLKVTFHGQFAADTDYLAVLEGVEGLNGEKLESPHIFQFTTASQAGEFSVSGSVSNETLEKLKSVSDSYNGVVVVLSGEPFFVDIDFEEEEPGDEFNEEEEDDDLIPLYAATVDTITGEYKIDGVREGTYYPVGFNIFQMMEEDEQYEFFFPDIYIYDPDNDFEPDNIEVNSSTTTDGVLSGIDLHLIDFSPIKFSDAVGRAENVISELENDPVTVGGATYYFYMDYYDEPSFKRKNTSFSATEMKTPSFKVPKLTVSNKKEVRAKVEEDEELWMFGNPNGYNFMWEVYAYDAVKDSALSVLVTSFGSEFMGYIGKEEAELPDGVQFSDIKILPDSYIDSDSATVIFEAEGGAEFIQSFSSSNNSESSYWEMDLQALHEFWDYSPDPTPTAPVFWKASYFGSRFDYENDEYSEDSLVIYLDIETGEVLHKNSSLPEAITFSQAVEIAQSLLGELENDPVIVGGGTDYWYEPLQTPEDSEDPGPTKSKTRFSKTTSSFTDTKVGHQLTPNGYQLEWEIFAYDAVKDSAAGFYITSENTEFLGYFGADDADLPEGVAFNSIKPLPESYIDSDAAAAIIEAEGGADFREAFSASSETEHSSWEMELLALHEYWTYSPDPTPEAPVMWQGIYHGYTYNHETEEQQEDSLIIFLDIETGEVLHKTLTSTESKTGLPNAIRLQQNYPNPFNPSTNIPFELNKASQVKLNIYNLLGQKVATLIDDAYPAGSHTISWNASGMASGVYFYSLETGGQTLTRKLLLLK